MCMNNHRVRHSLIVFSVFAVLAAACGNEVTSSESLAPPVAVQVSRSGSLGDSLSASPMAEAATDGGREIGLLPSFGGWVFEVGDGLPALPTGSTGYHFPAGTTVDASTVARIAAALGVAGEPQPGEPGTGIAWRVGPDDGSAPALFFMSDGLASWYFSGPWASFAVSSCVVVDLPADDVGEGDGVRGIEECETPEPPTGVPSAATAEAQARELLAALGNDPASLRFETYADEWSAFVGAQPTVGGLQWPIGYGFGFGGEGVLQWATGYLAEPVATGPYPLVDLEAALARLADQRGMWGYGVMAGAEARAAEDMPADAPSELVDAEPMVATLVDVRADLWWAWDVDGSVWLLPAYSFTSADGVTFTVPAVTDDYLIVVPVEPVPEPLPSEEVPGGVEPGAKGVPADLEALVEMPLPEFTAAAAGLGYTPTRVARRDGEDLALTMDYSESRVNVAVEGDVVVEILFIG